MARKSCYHPSRSLAVFVYFFLAIFLQLLCESHSKRPYLIFQRKSEDEDCSESANTKHQLRRTLNNDSPVSVREPQFEIRDEDYLWEKNNYNPTESIPRSVSKPTAKPSPAPSKNHTGEGLQPNAPHSKEYRDPPSVAKPSWSGDILDGSPTRSPNNYIDYDPPKTDKSKKAKSSKATTKCGKKGKKSSKKY